MVAEQNSERLIEEIETLKILIQQMEGVSKPLLQKSVRKLWDFRDAANEYFEEVVALLICILKLNEPGEFTVKQLSGLLQVVKKLEGIKLTDEDVEQCLDILDEYEIKRLPSIKEES